MVVHRYKYGENLYYNTRDVGIKDAVNAWMSEAPKYDYNKPGFSSATGKGDWCRATRRFICSSWTGPICFVILKQVYKTQHCLGHFTQVVWKSTTSVACAKASCPAGTITQMPSFFFVCRYAPPGNYQGQFPQNVGRQKRHFLL